MGLLLARTEDVKEGKSLIVKGEEGMEIALIRLNGEIYAYENVCPHMEGPVGEGEIEGGCISCPWHGWTFDIATGECQNAPGEEIKKIPITIDGDGIYL